MGFSLGRKVRKLAHLVIYEKFGILGLFELAGFRSN